MPAAGLPLTEPERLAALRSYQVLDTASEETFDDLVALAARLTHSPISVISLLDADRQWFKARHGFETVQTHRDFAFCSHAILSPGLPLIVADATKDLRFSDNPLVVGTPDIRAYLGVPLVNPEGHALGTLCVIDRVARPYDADTVRTVTTLARAVSVNLELRRTLLRVHSMAMTDPLTGLPNRRAVMIALSEALAVGRGASVISVDLDHFKEANDAEGHAAGDALLRAAAQRIEQALRPGDIVGRVGGDEFIAVLFDVVDRALATDIARRIGAVLHAPVVVGSKLLRLGATLGVAVAPADAAEPETVVRIADEAMVRAKRAGRGGVGGARPEDATRLARAAAMVRAFDADGAPGDAVQGAVVHLQPILTLGPAPELGGQVVAIEALTRWSHPELGAVKPVELVSMLGPQRAGRVWRTVRELAIAAFTALGDEGLKGVRLALNLSAGEVSQPDIALLVAEQVERAGLSLHAVEFEIKEDALLDRVSDRTLEQLSVLRGRGARLVLDDFGTGNAGLSQLLRLPLDGLKLDRRFVGRLGTDPRAAEIVRATVSMAHGLGLTVVAEGVETDRQAATLRALGVDRAQGFLFARPMPLEALRTWLRERALGGAAGVGRVERVRAPG